MRNYEKTFELMDVGQWDRKKLELIRRNCPTQWATILKTIVDEAMSRDQARDYITKEYLAVTPRMPDIDFDTSETH